MSLDLGLHRNHKLYRPDIGAEELEDSTRAFCGGKFGSAHFFSLTD